MSESQQTLEPWQRIYATPGAALDALHAWRPGLPVEERAQLWTIAEVPLRRGEYMLVMCYPAHVVIEIPEDGWRDAESTQTRVVSALKSCVDDAMAERGSP